MPIAISDEHEALGATVRRLLASRCPPALLRTYLDSEQEALPPFWSELARHGLLGLAIDEAFGGQGYGFGELAVVLEELGRALAPGPFLPTVLAAALIQQYGNDEVKGKRLPAIADGSAPAAVAFSGDVVLGGGVAQLLVVPVDGAWCVVEALGLAQPVPSLDPTRRLARLSAPVPDDHIVLEGLTTERVREFTAVLVAAEATGVAGWCVHTASEYAKVRRQFGRPIGQFQAIKHKCSNMLVAVEQARAVTWDAARAADDGGEASLPTAVAAALSLDAATECAKECVQVLGGLGFTWDHDAHLYLKRAMSLRQLLGGVAPWRAQVARLALSGRRRERRLDLPTEAESVRRTVVAFLDTLSQHDPTERHRRLAEEGYLAPHWPKPWGRGAGPVEQLVIEEEMARIGIPRLHLNVGAWAIPTLIAHGTPNQKERFIWPTLLSQISWCQLFSEPNAGSDLAALSTAATRVADGWEVSGHKIWTSLAEQADWGICLARTNPTAPKHEGITYFIVDMRSPGIEIRPLRDATGQTMFNEVLLSSVFVPDECVVGAVDDGWRVGRTTLANERVSMASGSSFGGGVENVLTLLAKRDAVATDPVVAQEVGALVSEAHSVAALSLRSAVRATSGIDAGVESSVRKLLGVEHDQRTQEFGLALLGAEGATTEGDAAQWTFGWLANRCLTIAGGTSEVQRNVIAERLLGLPRDP